MTAYAPSAEVLTMHFVMRQITPSVGPAKSHSVRKLVGIGHKQSEGGFAGIVIEAGKGVSAESCPPISRILIFDVDCVTDYTPKGGVFMTKTGTKTLFVLPASIRYIMDDRNTLKTAPNISVRLKR